MRISAYYPTLLDRENREIQKKLFLKNETFGHIKEFQPKFFNEVPRS